MKKLILFFPLLFQTALAVNFTDTLESGRSFSKEKNHSANVAPYSVRTADPNKTINYSTPDLNVSPFFTNGSSTIIHQTSVTTWNSDRVSQSFGFDAGEGNTLSADTFEAIFSDDPYRSELYFDLRGSNDGTNWTTIYENRKKRFEQFESSYSFPLATYRFLEFYVVYGTYENGGQYFQQYYNSSNFYFYNFRFSQQKTYGCTDPDSLNYDPNAEADDGTCSVCNSQNLQNCSETGCQTEDGFWDASQNLCRANTLGCTDPAAENFDENATVSDSSACIYCTAENPESCWTAESCENVGGVWYSESNICGTAFDDSSTSKNLPDTENSVFIDDPVSAGYHQTFQMKCERYNENFDCDNWRFDISEEFLTFGIDSIYKILLYFFGFVLLFGFSVWILRGIYKITFN